MTIPNTKNDPAAIANMHGQKDFIEEMNPEFFVGSHKKDPASIESMFKDLERNVPDEPIISKGLSGLNKIPEHICDTDVAHAYLTPILAFNKEV